MSDLHRGHVSGEIHLDLAIPLCRRQKPPSDSGRPAACGDFQPLGVIDIEVDPEKFLYPQIRDWPAPSPTAETLLVRREGDDVVFLNEVRHQQGLALSLRLPKDHPLDWRLRKAGNDSCAACHAAQEASDRSQRDRAFPTNPPHFASQAMCGGQGVMEGVDYRQRPVLAVTRGVPGTPWFIVAKVDQDEIYGPLRERGLTAAAFALVLVVVAALSVGLLWRHRDNRWLQTRLAAEREQKEHQRQYTLVLESQRQAMEELCEFAESATRAKSEFLANMSHEIRTPMTAILGYVNILAGQLETPEHVEALGIIRRNGDHLLAVINDILDLSKIEAGKLQIERNSCSPAAVAADVISLMRPRAKEKGLGLKLEFAGPAPETVSTDAIRLRQILLNLLGNAVKFTEAGGVRLIVRMAAGHHVPVVGGAGQRLVYEVVDTGIGMTPAQVEGLFQPFHQAETSTARRFGGTGLGLAIAKRLAEMLGGEIEVASHPGQGSTFTLSIDPGPLEGVAMLARATEALATPAARPAAQNPLPRLNCRILLAEDGDDNQRIISFLLTKAGAEVTAVNNGRKALEMALAGHRGTRGKLGQRWDDAIVPFNVILMDMQMPEMDGYEATHRLREEGYTGPIIALTAHAMADDRQKCLNAGCDDYATKPIDRATLIGAIAGIVGKQHNLQET